MKNKLLTISFLTLLFLSSCLKDKDYEDQKYGTQSTDATKLVTFLNAKNLPTAEKSSDSISLGGDVNVSAQNQVSTLINVTLESTIPSPVDVRVKIVVNPSIKPSTFSTLPIGTFSIPSEIIIPAGSRQVNVPITFTNTTTYSLTTTYALGLELVSVNGGGFQVASNRNKIVVAFSVKNQYDGKYSFKGYAFRANDPSLTGNFTGLTRTLSTTTATKVQMNGLLAWSNGSGIGIGEPSFDVNPSTNAVTISSPGGAINLPGYSSRYEPATRTFFIGATWGAGPAFRQSIDTLIYTGPR